MNPQVIFELEPIFQAVLQVMEQNRLEFNQADQVNGNHGDHMVAVFRMAAEAAMTHESTHDPDLSNESPPVNELAESMDLAAQLLKAEAENGSAQIYARGLSQLAEQFRRYNVEMADLVPYVQGVAQDSKVSEGEPVRRSGDVLKALLGGLAGWRQPDDAQDKPANPLDMGTMFDLGISYLQAKQRNPTRLEAIADAAASVSPLSSVPHRYQSSKVAILALLRALAAAAPQQVNKI